jgi:hypothetical protein
LPKPVLPESPGYVLNSFANFYFADNLSYVYRFNKQGKTWNKLDFYENEDGLFSV